MEHLRSPAAFVEGGVQDACEDSCSICLEGFSLSDPSALTCCQHEFHLQCILEWCQRSAQCPMCWRPISLQDPTSQELLQAVETERLLRSKRSRSPVSVHPMIRDLDVAAENASLDERIVQRLAEASIADNAVENNENRSNNFVSANFRNASSSRNANTLIIGQRTPSSPNRTPPVQPSSPSRNSSAQSAPVNNERVGPTDLSSLSETLKSRINAASNRYKETIKKSTNGWREKIFSRRASLSEIGSEVKREVNNGLTNVSRFVQQHLELKDDNNQNNPAELTSNNNNNNNNINNNNNANMTVRAHLARVAACDASSSTSSSSK